MLKVCAVVVTWRPDLALLDEALAALRPQVAAVLVIDNASPECAEIAARVAHAGGRFHGMRRNVGLARAQNLGARWAWAAGMDAILLMDQDSVAAPDMVALLA
ncbi:MAG TPA: glycosyltransferase, partial [Quisquiliibacterium sp.]|nr:glycosyltransferase [Quisquiliibacterium sp.]